MVTGFIYTVQHPTSMTKQFTTDVEYAELMSNEGNVVFGRRYKTVGD